MTLRGTQRLMLGIAAAFPVLFVTVFTVRYGYSPLVIALHLAQVALACVVVGAAFRFLQPPRAVVAIIGATLTSLYFLVVVLSTITNEAWGWSISIDLGRAYLHYLPAIVGNLPVSYGLIDLGLAALVVVLVVIYWQSWIIAGQGKKSRSLAPLRTTMVAIALTAFILIARRSPAAAAEPLTALFTAPGQPE